MKFLVRIDSDRECDEQGNQDGGLPLIGMVVLHSVLGTGCVQVRR